jgi:hypothetical protein
MSPIDVPQWVLIAATIAPLVVIFVIIGRWNRRWKMQRAAFLREIEASGGFEAWKAKHFGARGR